MIIDGALSLSQQASGRRYYNLFSLVNGISYMCLGETLIILFALRLQAPDYVIAFLSAFLFFGNFAMPVGKFITSKIGGAASVSLCWALRNVAALLVASAWFFRTTPAISLSIVMGGTLLFYSCRSAGTVVMQPLIGEITSADNRGKFISLNNMLFESARMGCIIVILLILHKSQTVTTLAVIIAIGSIFGFTSAFCLSRIKEGPSLRESAKKSILSEISKTFRLKHLRQQLTANYVTSLAIAMTVPISMLALKQGYGINDMDALLFSVVQIIGGIGASWLIGLISGETGPRPILLLCQGMLVILCGFWIFAPAAFHWNLACWPFLLAGAAANGISIGCAQYFLLIVPNEERIGASLTLYSFSGVLAALTTMLLSGFLLKYIPLIPFDAFADCVAAISPDSTWIPFLRGFLCAKIRVYQLYFLCMFFLVILGFLPILKLKTHSGWSVSDVLGLAFAPRDIMTLYNLYRFNPVPTPEEEAENIAKLGHAHSGLSEKALLDSLNSPKLILRGRALLAIGDLPPTPAVRTAILHELEFGEHTTANTAAMIAGKLKIAEAVPFLRNYLWHTQNYFLMGKSMVALAQLQDTVSYNKIETIFRESDNPRLIMHGAAALVEINDPKAFRLLLDKSVQDGLPQEALPDVLCSAAQLAGFGDDFYKFLKVWPKSRDQAALILTELCTAPWTERTDPRVLPLVRSFQSGKFDNKTLFEQLLALHRNTINSSAVICSVLNFIELLTTLPHVNSLSPLIAWLLIPPAVHPDGLIQNKESK